MITLWAPLTGDVRDTLKYGLSFLRMMRARLTHNELTALIIDRFKLVQRGIEPPSVIHHISLDQLVPHPRQMLKNLHKRTRMPP